MICGERGEGESSPRSVLEMLLNCPGTVLDRTIHVSLYDLFFLELKSASLRRKLVVGRYVPPHLLGVHQ
jgi:hypothetical protein